MKKHFARLVAVVLAALLIVPAFSFSASADNLTPVSYRAGANSISSSYAGSHYYSNFLKIKLTGDGRTDTLAVALSQLGYMESNSSSDFSGTSAGSGNYTEYCYNMGSVGGYGYQWCATFCSWSLYQARCTDQGSTGDWCRNHLYSSSAYIWREVGCAYWANQLKYYGYYQQSGYNGGSYTPQPGDLIFFYSGGGINHIGFVLYTSGGYVYTVEGNTGGSAGVVANGGRVCAKSYTLGSSSIAGYGVLPYKEVNNQYTNIDYSGGNRTPGYYNNPDAAKYIYSDEACTQSLGVVARYTMFEVTQVCASGKVKCNATLDNGTNVTGYMDPSSSRIIQITATGVTYSQEFLNLRDLVNSTLELQCVDYTASEAIAVRAAYANAVQLLNDENATDAQYAAAYNELYAAIHPTANILSIGKYYTRTAPARGDAYDDDNARLTDGVKGYPDGGAIFNDKGVYSGWSNSAEIAVDLGYAQNANTFTVYMAGGPWGISVPDENYTFSIQYSNDDTNYTPLDSSNYSVLKRGDGTELDWSNYDITLNTQTVNARYYKFILSRGNGGFVWIDEVEVAYYTEAFLSDKLYINGVNSAVRAGDCIVFTPAIGTVTAANANHVWTQNVVAKWDSDKNGYVITRTFHGDGTGVDVTLASDEIMIAAHAWEGSGVENAVPGSALNHQKLQNCQVGDLIQLSNVTVELGYYDVLAYATLTPAQACSHNYSAKVQAPTCTHTGYTVYTCTSCGDTYTDNYVSEKGHTEGDWKTLSDGSQELRCSDCGILLDSKPASGTSYETGDVNADGSVDMFDYLMIKNIYFKKYTPNSAELARADLDGSGEVDMFDYMMLKTFCFQ